MKYIKCLFGFQTYQSFTLSRLSNLLTLSIFQIIQSKNIKSSAYKSCNPLNLSNLSIYKSFDYNLIF